MARSPFLPPARHFTASPVDPKTRPTPPTLRGFKLLKNYRSHEAILWYPNEKFYDNELETFSPTFPVVFHAISGKNEREAPSPSWFNRMEAIQVEAYVTALVQDRQFPVRGLEQEPLTGRKIRPDGTMQS
ncbi:hypothetical protein V8D89_007693 [Ganoderma adspersum]